MKIGNKTLSLILKVIKLCWKCSGINIVLIILTNVISGLGTPILLLIWKQFIDNATAMLENHSMGISTVIVPLVIHFVIILVSGLLVKVSDYLIKNQADYLKSYMSYIMKGVKN